MGVSMPIIHEPVPDLLEGIVAPPPVKPEPVSSREVSPEADSGFEFVIEDDPEEDILAIPKPEPREASPPVKPEEEEPDEKEPPPAFVQPRSPEPEHDPGWEYADSWRTWMNNRKR